MALKLSERNWMYDCKLKTWFLNPTPENLEKEEHEYFNIETWKIEKTKAKLHPSNLMSRMEFENN